MENCKFTGNHVFLFCVLVILLIVYIGKENKSFSNHQNFEKTPRKKDADETRSFLRGCSHIYLDVGSNIGNQIRKLYQPELYPKATKVQKIFQQYFGEQRQDVCTIGFEPNNMLTDKLKSLENSYNKCGWKVKIFTRTAVGNYTGEGLLTVQGNTAKDFFWGSGLDGTRRMKGPTINFTVSVVKLSSFITNYIANRQVNGQANPAVVMKLDIEGTEFSVLPDLIFNGALRYINFSFIEFHERFHANRYELKLMKILRKFMINNANQFSSEMKISDLDDETYHRSQFDLPSC